MRRLTAIIATTALAATPLAACGSDDDDGGGGGGEPSGPQPQQVVDQGNASAGEKVFADKCAACHGEDGGGGSGPKLAGEETYTDPGIVVDQVRNGGGGMPAFGDQLSEQELADVSAFVVKDLAAK